MNYANYRAILAGSVPHQMHDIRTIAIDVSGVCQSVCHAPSLCGTDRGTACYADRDAISSVYSTRSLPA